MNPESVTPMILTWNEEDNLERTLQRLGWASEVLVVDSLSDDRTLGICSSHPNVRVIQRAMDSLASQANHGLSEIRTPWVLSLDADYVMPDSFGKWLETFDPGDSVGGSAEFRYCVFGRALRGTLYPPRVVLHKKEGATYVQDGHAHRVVVPGKVVNMDIKIDHDDRKPLTRWFSSQCHYASQEARKLQQADQASLSLQDRIRARIWFAPLLVGIWVLLVRGCVLDGQAGVYYAFQRVLAELMLSICLLDRCLRKTER